MIEENQTIIKALNMFGRVPETWELLNEIERLNNRIDKAIEYIKSNYIDNPIEFKDDLLKILGDE